MPCYQLSSPRRPQYLSATSLKRLRYRTRGIIDFCQQLTTVTVTIDGQDVLICAILLFLFVESHLVSFDVRVTRTFYEPVVLLQKRPGVELLRSRLFQSEE